MDRFDDVTDILRKKIQHDTATAEQIIGRMYLISDSHDNILIQKKRAIIKNWVLIDNQPPLHVILNPKLLNDIQNI